MAKLDIEKAIATELGTMAAQTLARPLLRFACLWLASKWTGEGPRTTVGRAATYETFVLGESANKTEAEEPTV